MRQGHVHESRGKVQKLETVGRNNGRFGELEGDACCPIIVGKGVGHEIDGFASSVERMTELWGLAEYDATAMIYAFYPVVGEKFKVMTS